MPQKETIDHQLIRNTLPAVVQVVALRQSMMGNLSAVWTGSGTIVHPQGVILTNCHVANPQAMGMPAPPADRLAIAITERSDEPPVLTYVVDVVAQSPELDLAVLRIVGRVDGKREAEVDLPYVPIGDSDILELGDVLSIFGYPGIGGDTVTFTSGSVSGFTQEREVTTGRAWIKTDATIAGGNSGGTAVNVNGQLVGIPTQAAAGSGVSPVDARPVVDTNRDGVVDQRDTPMAIGGFINGLRPVNLAKPLLAKIGMDVSARQPARPTAAPSSGQRSPQPATAPQRGESAPAPTPTESRRPGGLKPFNKPSAGAPAAPKAAATPRFTNLVFSDKVTQDGRPVNPSAILSGGRKELFASFEFADLRDGLRWGQTWSVDGNKVYEDGGPWQDGATGHKTIAVTSRQTLPDGQYHLALTIENQIAAQGEVTIGRRAEDKDSEVSGMVVDRETQQGLAEAQVIVLKPGLRANDFLQAQKQEMVFTSTRTDRAGHFTLPKQLPKGQSYGLVVLVQGYRNMAIENALRISAQAPEKAQINPVPMIRA